MRWKKIQIQLNLKDTLFHWAMMFKLNLRIFTLMYCLIKSISRKYDGVEALLIFWKQNWSHTLLPRTILCIFNLRIFALMPSLETSRSRLTGEWWILSQSRRQLCSGDDDDDFCPWTTTAAAVGTTMLTAAAFWFCCVSSWIDVVADRVQELVLMILWELSLASWWWFLCKICCSRSGSTDAVRRTQECCSNGTLLMFEDGLALSKRCRLCKRCLRASTFSMKASRIDPCLLPITNAVNNHVSTKNSIKFFFCMRVYAHVWINIIWDKIELHVYDNVCRTIMVFKKGGVLFWY